MACFKLWEKCGKQKTLNPTTRPHQRLLIFIDTIKKILFAYISRCFRSFEPLLLKGLSNLLLHNPECFSVVLGELYKKRGKTVGGSPLPNYGMREHLWKQTNLNSTRYRFSNLTAIEIGISPGFIS